MPKADVSMMKIQIEDLITYSGKPALIPTVILRAEMEELRRERKTFLVRACISDCRKRINRAKVKDCCCQLENRKEVPKDVEGARFRALLSGSIVQRKI